MRVELVSTEEDFVALRAEWERLLNAGAGTTPFQTWWVTYHAWRMNADAPTPFLLVARDHDGEVRGILPLGVESSRRGPFTWRVLQTIGPRQIDFADVVALPADASRVLGAFLGWLARHWRRWDELRLSPVREDSVFVQRLGQTMPPRLELDLDPVSENFAVTIPGGARGWEDVCDGETRRGLRRTLRRLEASGFVVRRVSTGYPADRALAALVGLHDRRRTELGGTSRLVTAERKELAELVAASVSHGGDLWVMEHDGVAVAAQLTLRHGKSVSHYRVAHDSEFRAASPGIGLLIAAINDTIASGATEYDFGFGAEEYKRRWANVRRTVYRVRIANQHPGRLLRRTWAFVSTRSRRLLRRLRQSRLSAGATAEENLELR